MNSEREKVDQSDKIIHRERMKLWDSGRKQNLQILPEHGKELKNTDK